MIHRIAARHLLFVVSILLCFFAYMGYSMRSQAPVEGGDVASSIDLASLSGEAEVSPPGSMGAPSEPSSSSSPFVLPSGMPSGSAVEEAVEEWVSSHSGTSLPSAPAGMRPPAATSAPATEAAGATSHSGSIRGLVPGMVPTPPGGGSEPTAELAVIEEEEEPPPILVLPGGGGLRPSSGPSSVQSSLPPPPSAETRAEPETATVVETRPGGASLLPPPGYVADNDAEEEDDADDGDDFPTSSAPQVAMRPTSETRPPSLVPPPARTTPRPPEARDDNFPRPAYGSADGDNEPQRVPPGRETPPASETTRIYVVRPGDTLSSIAARELGSASLADNIFLGNRGVIHDPDQLMVGSKIRLPVRDSLSMGYDDGPVTAPGAVAPPVRKPTQGLGRVHTVARGDTLSSIAQHYYGTSANWRFLYEANKGVMANPNQLSVGMELVIPPYEELQGDM